MITLDEFTELPSEAKGGFLAVGNFDGVHLGHAHLIARLRANADRFGAPALALTFDPHPIALLRPAQAPSPLVWTERKAELLQQAGASGVGVFQTGPWLLGLTAREFFERIIVGRLQARGMVEGPNFAFGRDRGGDATLLGEWCSRAGMHFEIIRPTVFDDALVSSTAIRRALAEGRPELAQRLLGHPHRIRGIVVRGLSRGRDLGFPTANLDKIDALIPDDGVYATLAYPRDRLGPVPSATHVGPNVTFGERDRTVEAHLIDFTGDLYGQTLELEFLRRLRPSRKFEGLDDLIGQLRRDVDDARSACGELQ